MSLPATQTWVRVALDLPLFQDFDYQVPSGLSVQIGQRVLVPFGKQRHIGVVVQVLEHCDVPVDKQKAIFAVLDDLPPFSQGWLDFCAFAAAYYLRPLGEVILPALPPPLRQPQAYQPKRGATSPLARLRLSKRRVPTQIDPPKTLNDEQAAVLQAVAQGQRRVLLHGITGSGKTEVYLQLAEQTLAQGKQVLFLVPEINLTPQFIQQIMQRFAHRYGVDALWVLHSGLANGERLQAWQAMQTGQARLVLGTRMAVFSPLDALGLVIVDEEHDASYKQQEGLRYSARDLAIWRAHQQSATIVLGSATPALESWHGQQQGRYHLCRLTQRASQGHVPQISLLFTPPHSLTEGLSTPLLQAMQARLDKGEQSMVFLNRRGFSPVLRCRACHWASECPNCSVRMVLHRDGQPLLRCHHCGHACWVPPHCPQCGNQDLNPVGQGTQRLEAFLQSRFPTARIARIDADSTQRKGSVDALFEQVHRGEVDIVVGTQMLAKGHDFKRLGLVGVINADASLLHYDFRASERLFSQLLQVAGRAGRHLPDGQVLIQTEYPEHMVYQYLLQQDYVGFAQQVLAERESMGLPPFSYQVLISAQGSQLQQVMDFLNQMHDLATQALPEACAAVRLSAPVPHPIVRLAKQERAHVLVEASSRQALHHFVRQWLALVCQTLKPGSVKYWVEVDPLQV